MNNLARGMGELMRITVAAAIAGLALVGLSVASESQAAVKRFTNISAQGLESALVTLEKDRDLEVIFVAEDIRDVRTEGAVGEFTPEETLRRLLIGTGLTYRYLDDKTVTILPAQVLPTAGANSSSHSDPAWTPQYPLLEQERAGTVVARAEGQEQKSSEAEKNPSSPSLEGEENKTDLNEILVTGTRISGLDNKTAPAVVLGRDTIDKSGYSTTQELIRSLPQNFAGGQSGASEDGVFGIAASSGLNFTGASGINLRGLGNSSTLVLLNGHRMAPSAYGSFVDISLIPLAAIERVEVLTHGTSALYGSDAVGGVVNIITRSDYEGADTSIRYGSADGDTREEKLFAQTLGTNWGSGNVVATAQYMEQDALRSEDRDFTESIPSPTYILPEARMYGITANVDQAVTDRMKFYVNTLFARRDIDRVFNDFDTLRTSDASSRTSSTGAGFEYELTPSWSLRVGGEFSEQDSDQVLVLPASRVLHDLNSKDMGADIVLDGDLLQTDAGPISLAAGVSYREQQFEQHSILEFGVPVDAKVDREIKAAFSEVYVPIISEASDTPLINALAFSAAVRYDDYSDFGSTTNPRVGIYWSPSSQFSVRAAYSKSFRAPNASELLNIGTKILVVLPVENPQGGPDPVPAFVAVGSDDEIGAERARMVEVGFDFVPQSVPDLKVSVDYYQIRYKDRIVLPPFDAGALTRPEVYGSLITPLASDAEAQEVVDAAVADGWIYFDAVGTGAVGVRNVIDIRQQNAALVEQSGFDIRATYTQTVASGAFSTTASIASIDEIDTAFAIDAESTDIVDTIGNPLRWRARAEFAWETTGWRVTSAVNYSNDYLNDSVIGGEPVDSWTTVDVTAKLMLEKFFNPALFDGLAITLSALNLFNEDPPLVNAPGLIDVGYDPANANPLGRQLALEVAKSW